VPRERRAEFEPSAPAAARTSQAFTDSPSARAAASTPARRLSGRSGRGARRPCRLESVDVNHTDGDLLAGRRPALEFAGVGSDETESRNAVRTGDEDLLDHVTTVRKAAIERCSEICGWPVLWKSASFGSA
jgi:hypothetical protein